MILYESILVVAYTAVFALIILRVKFFRTFSISPEFIVGLFLIRIAAGITYGIVHQHFYKGADTISFFTDGKIIFSSLSAGHIHDYFKLVFGYNHPPPDVDILPYARAMNYWNDMSAYSIVRFNAVCMLFSFGFYNVHVVFYNFFTLIAFLYLFEFCCEVAPAKRIFLMIAIFIFPSVVFWSSGIHKDGISVAAIGVILYFLSRLINSPKILQSQNTRNVIGFLIGCWILVVVRGFVMLLLMPALLAFIWSSYSPRYLLIKFLIVFSLYFGIASNLNFIKPDWDFLNLIVVKQSQFREMAGQSFQLRVPKIIPTITSIVSGIPRALENCFFRPWITEAANSLQLADAVENFTIILLLFTSIFIHKKKLSRAEQQLLLFCTFFMLTIFIVVGITIPIVGALVRYKMAGVLFLLVAIILIVKDECAPAKVRWLNFKLRGDLNEAM